MRLTDQMIRCLMVAGVQRRLKERAWLLDAFTVSETYTHEIEYEGAPRPGSIVSLEKLKYPDLKLGDVVRVNKKVVGVIDFEQNDLMELQILVPTTEPVFHMLDVFDAPLATVKEHFGVCPLTSKPWKDTTIGRYIVNILTLQYPTDFKQFEYINDRWKPDKILKMVQDTMLANKITVQQYERFLDYLYFIGHMTELNTPSMTIRSLQTNPKVPELKRKFLEEHKGQMHDPLVIQKLEQMLIEADKEYLGDDESVTFFNGLGSKSYDVQRKKLFLTVGGIPAFGADVSGVDFIPNSLSEGWTKEAIPSIANEIRKGSYERGVKTALGGAETKFVFRVFQDAVISEDDCGTTRTIDVDCSLFDGRVFLGRTIRVGGSDIVVTKENLEKYVLGKVIHLYSPLTCATKNNFCYKCCGVNARKLNAKQLGVQTIKITNGFMYLSMKNMHGTALVVRDNSLKDILL